MLDLERAVSRESVTMSVTVGGSGEVWGFWCQLLRRGWSPAELVSVSQPHLISRLLSVFFLLPSDMLFPLNNLI